MKRLEKYVQRDENALCAMYGFDNKIKIIDNIYIYR